MEIYENIVCPNMNSFYDAFFELKEESIVFIDIETTGFNRKLDQVILIGMLYMKKKHYILKQYFIGQDSNDESVLKAFKEDLSSFAVAVSYNGRTFDFPFLKDRMAHYGELFPFNKLLHIDLYTHLRKHKNDFSLESMSLKSIETHLGIKRTDSLSGKESIEKFYEYRRTLKKSIKKEILLHNEEDLIFLPEVSIMLKDVEKPECVYHTFYQTLDHPSGNLFIELEPSGLSFKKRLFCIKGKATAKAKFKEIHLYDESYDFTYSPLDQSFELMIRLKNKELKGYQIDYIDDLSISIVEEKEPLVYHNFIMVINNRLMIKEAFNFSIEIIPKLFTKYLSLF